MPNRYWVGGTADWNATAGTKWSLTSGGTGDQAVPIAADDVFMDAASGTVTVTVATVTGVCRSFNATGFTGSLVISAELDIGDGTVGHFTLGSGMGTVTGVNIVKFISTATGNNITTNGITIATYVRFNGVGGSWTLQSALTQTVNTDVTVTNGTLNTNGYSLTCVTLSHDGVGATITLGASTVTVTGTGSVVAFASGGTFNVNTGTFSITDTSATQKAFAGGGYTFGTVNITGGGTGIVLYQNSSTFSNFPQITGGTKNVRFTAGTTQTFTAGTSFGNGSNLITIDTQTAASAATLSKATGVVSCTSLSLKDNTATGGATWYAGATPPSIDNTGNTGWTFAAEPVPASGNGVQQNSILLGVG